MRVGYLTAKDPTDPWCWSGTGHYMYKSLIENGLDVVHIGRTLLPWSARLPWPLGKAAWLVERSAKSAPEIIERSKRWGAALTRELAYTHCDVLFAPVAAMELRYFETDLPMACTSDTTFRLLRNYYARLRKLAPDVADFREEVEAHAVARADLLLYPSHWAAESATRDYGADSAKVRVIPYGANIPSVPDIDQILSKRTFNECRLLFVGKDWERKGGDIAVECLKTLLAQDIEAVLTVCGGSPPEHAQHPNVVYAGMLDKRNPQDLARYHQLLEQSHFMIVPSRAEAYGIVFCEASGFGVPSLATQTGGIPTIVRDGENGFALPLSATGEDFARHIAELFTEPERYTELAHRARAAYDNSLNWHAWGRQTASEISQLHTRSCVQTSGDA